MILPGSWAALLAPLRLVFARHGTFTLFTILATGMVARTGRRSVVGMLAGARMVEQVSFHAACRFFSHAVWDIDKLGLAVARLIVARLLPCGEPIVVVVDDTLFRRWGRRVHHVFWTHDGAAQGRHKIGRGNRWVVAGIVVRLRFCSAPVCLPVLFRLWAGKGTASVVELAGEMIKLIVVEFAGRHVHVVGDAAYHGRALLVDGASVTTRLPVNAALYAPAPPRTGKRGRPALKGRKLGTPEQVAATVGWRPVTCYRYGFTETVDVAEVDCVWYGSFGNTAGRLVLVRDRASTKPYDLALFTTDVTGTTAAVVERYATRWSIEPANATSKQQMGVGQARNRLPKAVHRTVPFGMLVQSLVIIWYTVVGYHPDDIARRRQAEPWYDLKTEPSFEDMIIKLRKAIIAARFSGVSPAQADPEILRDYALACEAAAA